jgi:hypothetical protein
VGLRGMHAAGHSCTRFSRPHSCALPAAPSKGGTRAPRLRLPPLAIPGRLRRPTTHTSGSPNPFGHEGQPSFTHSHTTPHHYQPPHQRLPQPTRPGRPYPSPLLLPECPSPSLRFFGAATITRPQPFNYFGSFQAWVSDQQLEHMGALSCGFRLGNWQQASSCPLPASSLRHALARRSIGGSVLQLIRRREQFSQVGP